MSHPDTSGASKRIDAAIDRALDDERIVGAVVLVVAQGETVHRRAAGFADREAGAPMHEDAIFRLASITKPIGTTAAMRLVQEGRLDLRAPVSRWLPNFRPALDDGPAPEIVIHHLLTHTSGLGYRFLEPPGGPPPPAPGSPCGSPCATGSNPARSP